MPRPHPSGVFGDARSSLLGCGEEFRCSRKRVERLMRQAGVQGIYRRCRRAAPDATGRRAQR